MTKIPYKALLDRYLQLSLPARIALAAIIGIIAGPGLLAFLTEFATYRYALHQGVRPPLEGIPYLKAAVALGSLTLSFAAAGVFLVVVWFAAKVASFMIGAIAVFGKITEIYRRILALRDIRFTMRVSSAVEGIRGLQFKKLVLVALLVGMVFGGVGYVYTEFLLDVGSFLEEAADLGAQPDPRVVGWSLGILGLVSTFLLWRKHMVWWVAGISVVGLYCTAFTAMFIPGYYASFLRLVGYGGGLPIEVELKEADSSGESRYGKFLVLRTTSAVMLYDPTSETIQEVPYSNIHSVRHDARRLHSLPFVLPAQQRGPESRGKSEPLGADSQQEDDDEGEG